jgi:hypothetical protein
MEARVFLQQQRDDAQLIEIICSDEATMKAVAHWIANKNDTRQADAEEGASNEGFNQLKDYLMSMKIEELAEMLVDIERPDLIVSLLTKADSSILETKNQAKKMVVKEDTKGVGHADGAVGISLDQQQGNADVGYERVMTEVNEDKAPSHKPIWSFPSPENTGDFSTLNRVTEEPQSPILKGEFTQTNSLSMEYEHTKELVSVEVQTEPTELVRISLITFRNINSYHVNTTCHKRHEQHT